VAETVTISGPRTIVTHIVSPALERTTTMTAAMDGLTARYVSIDHRPGISTALRTEYLARRMAAGPAGAHPVSGTWQGVKYVAVPELVRTTTLRVTGDRFSYSTPLGTSFTARLGGSAVPLRTTSGSDLRVAVRRTGPRTITETVTRGGEIVAVRTFKLSPDRQSLEIATTDPATRTTFRAISRRRTERTHYRRHLTARPSGTAPKRPDQRREAHDQACERADRRCIREIAH
jgi:hypothetical protein